MTRLLAWWRAFRARHLCAPDPWDGRPTVTYARPGPGTLSWGGAKPAVMPRIIPMAFRRPSGELVYGWRVFAHNDGERAEILYLEDCGQRGVA